MLHTTKSGDLTIGELMFRLRKEDMMLGSEFMEAIWDADDPTIDMDPDYDDDAEFIAAKPKLTQEIEKTIPVVTRKQSLLSEITYDIDAMTAEEVQNKLVCKCKAFKDKYTKKADSEADSEADSLDKLDRFTEKLVHSNTISFRSGSLMVQPDLPQTGAYCKQFMSVKDYAIAFIDDILEEAQEKVNLGIEYNICGEDVEAPTTGSKPSSKTQISGHIDWGSYLIIEDFTPNAGKQFILNIIRNTWNIRKTWSYCVNFIVENCDTCSNFYIYEVKWSMPNWSYPIPQVTVSVFFTIEVSRIKQRDCPVDITYNFETERYKFTLDDDIQHDAFLEDIMKCKFEFFRNLRR